jgi:hypothetical protein
MHRAGFEPVTPATKRPQTYATRIGRNHNRTMNFGCWNVQGISTNTDILIEELNKYDMDIIQINTHNIGWVTFLVNSVCIKFIIS